MLPSQKTMEPSGMTTGPSGKPRFEASSVPSTGVPSEGLTGEIGVRAYQSVIQLRTAGQRMREAIRKGAAAASCDCLLEHPTTAPRYGKVPSATLGHPSWRTQ